MTLAGSAKKSACVHDKAAPARRRAPPWTHRNSGWAAGSMSKACRRAKRVRKASGRHQPALGPTSSNSSLGGVQLASQSSTPTRNGAHSERRATRARMCQNRPPVRSAPAFKSTPTCPARRSSTFGPQDRPWDRSRSDPRRTREAQACRYSLQGRSRDRNAAWRCP